MDPVAIRRPVGDAMSVCVGKVVHKHPAGDDSPAFMPTYGILPISSVLLLASGIDVCNEVLTVDAQFCRAGASLYFRLRSSVV